MLGVAVTVKSTPLLVSPPTKASTLPVVAPFGAGTAIEVLAQLVGVAAVPLNVTVLVPWIVPKPFPVIVSAVPTGPDVFERVLILGATMNETPLLA